MSERTRYGSSGATTGLLVFVALVVALVPLPIGSVRPIVWALWIAASSLALIAFVLAGGRRISSPPRWIAVLQWLLLLTLICQMLPIGLIQPITFDLAGFDVTSDFLSLNPTATFLMTLRLAGYGLFLALVLTVAANPQRATLLLHLGFAVVVAYAALGMLLLVQWGDTNLGGAKWVYQGFATGPFINHNSFASLLGMGLSVGAACLFAVLASDHPRSRRLVYSIAIVLGLVIVGTALLATGSRMGALAGLAGGGVITFIGMRRLNRMAGWLTLLVGLAACGILFAVGAGDGLLTRTFGIDASLDSRWALYTQVWEAILKRPLLGYGGGSFYWAFAPLSHPPLLGDVEWTKAHSTVLQWWFELGLVAGSIPLLLYGSALLRSVRRSFSAEGWYLGLAATGAMITAGLHSVIDFPLEIPANAYFLIMLIGIGLAARRSGPEG